MHCDDEDPIGRFLIAIEQEHPRPRPQDEPSRRPPATKLGASKRKRFERSQRARNSRPSVIRKVERGDRVVYVPLSLRGDDYLRHSDQLVERRSLAASCLD